MSTSAEARSARVRSALQLLREEPELVGVVLYLVASGDLKSRCTGYVAHEVLLPFLGMTKVEALVHGPRVLSFAGSDHVDVYDLRAWLRRIEQDRTDFAPAVPRALPPAPPSNPARF